MTVDYNQLKERKEAILKELYPYVQFGKRCFAYCGEQCDCDLSIPQEQWRIALRQASGQLKEEAECKTTNHTSNDIA